MRLFAAPDVQQLRTRGDVAGLRRILGSRGDSALRGEALEALAFLGWQPTFADLRSELDKGRGDTARMLVHLGCTIDLERAASSSIRTDHSRGASSEENDRASELRTALVLLVGLDPWPAEASPERSDLLDTIRALIQPTGQQLVTSLLRVLGEDPSPDHRALAANVLGLLHADYRQFEAKGLLDHYLLEFKFASGGRFVGHRLSARDLRDARRGAPQPALTPDALVIEALRTALRDEGDVSLDPAFSALPCLDLDVALLAAPGQLEGNAFTCNWHSGVSYAAALALLLLGDHEGVAAAARKSAASTKRDMGGYWRTGFFVLAHQLGCSQLVAEFTQICQQHQTETSVWKRGTHLRACAQASLDLFDVGPPEAIQSSGSSGAADAIEGGDASLGGIQALVDSYAVELAKGPVHIRPNIPPELLANALATYARGVAKEEVVLQADSTVRGSGKAGLILTPTTLYAHDVGETWDVPLGEIRTVELKRRSFRVNQRSVGLVPGRAVNQALAALLLDLARWASRPASRTPPPPPSPPPPPGGK